MNLGTKLANIIDTLKSKNQMDYSYEKNGHSEYDVFSFKTTIDGNHYTVQHFNELRPNWKDSGVRGDFLYIVTVTDKDHNKLAELSTTIGSPHSFILSPQDSKVIDLEKLKEISNGLDTLPKKENNQHMAFAIEDIVKELKSKGFLDYSYDDKNTITHNNDSKYNLKHSQEKNNVMKNITLQDKPFYSLYITDKENNHVAQLVSNISAGTYLFLPNNEKKFDAPKILDICKQLNPVMEKSVAINNMQTIREHYKVGAGNGNTLKFDWK